jgi:hypothetical protein
VRRSRAKSGGAPPPTAEELSAIEGQARQDAADRLDRISARIAAIGLGLDAFDAFAPKKP